MGFFSGLKRSWKDGSLMNNLQAAGAIANGDYATAAQIKSLYQRQRDEEAQAQAKAQAAQAAVAALVRQGIPEADAVALVQSGAADNVLSSRFGQQSSNIDLREDNAGNVWQFDKRTGQPIGDKPVWVDRTPKEFVHDGMRISVGNPWATGGPTAPPPITPEDWGRGTPIAGGAVSNGGSNFLDAFAPYRF